MRFENEAGIATEATFERGGREFAVHEAWRIGTEEHGVRVLFGQCVDGDVAIGEHAERNGPRAFNVALDGIGTEEDVRGVVAARLAGDKTLLREGLPIPFTHPLHFLATVCGHIADGVVFSVPGLRRKLVELFARDERGANAVTAEDGDVFQLRC